MSITCTGFKSEVKGYKIGVASFIIEKWGFSLTNISVIQKDGKRWLSPPAKGVDGPDGNLLWTPYFNFLERKNWESFQEVALRAMDAWCLGSQQAPVMQPQPQQSAPQQEQQQEQQYKDGLPF